MTTNSSVNVYPFLYSYDSLEAQTLPDNGIYNFKLSVA